ncbi:MULTISPECIES: hypothetical protein [unclassified Endozoicomonas]|uniref:hypothetical protein n=1 Tax=unclassified Endozoicomonas TaxID=2644528 RepID=UPI0021497FA4|nr:MULTISPECIES: hypothetical protein [unclassified Endozoicomonas]
MKSFQDHLIESEIKEIIEGAFNDHFKMGFSSKDSFSVSSKGSVHAKGSSKEAGEVSNIVFKSAKGSNFKAQIESLWNTSKDVSTFVKKINQEIDSNTAFVKANSSDKKSVSKINKKIETYQKIVSSIERLGKKK